MENKDIKIALEYNLDEINAILTMLGSLPFAQSAQIINNIQQQAASQLPVQDVESKDVEATVN